MKTVVTHDGRAHRDEFLSIGLLLHAAIIDPGTPIYRRQPEAAELADPKCIVLDTGGDFDKELNNWDHHQMNGSAVCTFTLLAEHFRVPNLGDMTYSDLFEEFGWYKATAVMDSLGVAGLHILNVDGFPDELRSPIEESLLDRMSREPIVSSMTKDFAYETIRLQVEASRKLVDRINELRNNEERTNRWEESGLDILQFKGDSFGIPQYRKKFKVPINIAISYDNRGDATGWSLYRFKGDVDFNRVKEDDRITYVHPEGYLAKTDERYGREDLRELIAKSIVRKGG